MNEENNILTIYNSKNKSLVFLIPIVIFSLLTITVLFFAEGPNDARIFITIFFSCFNAFFIYLFYSNNKANQTAMFIKENGISYNGKVLHVKETDINNDNKTTRNLLVSFNNGQQEKLIVTPHFPYYIKTKYSNLVGLISNDFNTDDYNYCYKENIIEHTQYIGKGYISFEPLDATMKLSRYNDSRNNNYEGEISCKVFEYDGKYVIDEFEGLDIKKIKNENLFTKISIILFIVITICVLFFNR